MSSRACGLGGGIIIEANKDPLSSNNKAASQGSEQGGQIPEACLLYFSCHVGES